MRVLVCGGRKFNDMAFLWAVLDQYHSLTGPISVVIHGAATGADELGKAWAVHHGIKEEGYKAEWTKYRDAAGPIRNRRMLAVGEPDLVLAFPGGDGTDDCVKQARRLGIEVVRFIANKPDTLN